MSYEWAIAVDPLNAVCELRHDTGGWTITAVPTTLSDGRPGQKFVIPAATPNANGAQLQITAPKKVPILLRGVLMLTTEAYLKVDDFHLADATVTLPRLVLNGDVLKQDVQA